MELNLTSWATSALPIGDAGWLIAAFVYRSGPTRPVNQALAFLLLLGYGLLKTQLLNIDGTLYGALAAGAVALALSRLRRDAQVLADRLMPGVKGSPGHRARRGEDLPRAPVGA